MRQLEPGQMIGGKYRLLKPLAKGGMGEVWTAENTQLDVPVAIKFMSAEALSVADLVVRFEREAKAAAQLRSAQVVNVYEHGVVDGVPYMVMELLEGEDLGKRLRTRGRLSLAETAWIAGEVCKALRRAHELKIVHRDLKPGNIFLARSGDDEVVKVLDFGIAKLLTPATGDVTKTGALLGTPHYMSPEQARRSSQSVDHRSDLWALGVICYRALCGKLPFAGEDVIETLLKICSQPAPPITGYAPELGPAADRFFAKALSRDPAQRFQSARDFADTLQGLAGVPQAHPLGQSWSNGPPVAMPSTPSAVPPPRSSSPGGGPPPPKVGMRGTLPLPSEQQGAFSAAMAAAREAVQAAGPLPAPPRPASSPEEEGADGAVTVPIQKSPAGQALLKAAAPAGDRGVGVTQPMSPVVDVPRGGVGRTMPVEPALPAVFPARESFSSDAGSSRREVPGFPTSAGAMTSYGESGTITNATGEMSAATRGKTSAVVWIAAAAAVIVILVVGAAVVSSLGAQPEGEAPPMPLPTQSASVLVVPPDSVPAPTPPAPTSPAPVNTVAPSRTAGPTSTAPGASAIPGGAPQGAPSSATNAPSATPVAPPTSSATQVAPGAKGGGGATGKVTTPPAAPKKQSALRDDTL